MLPGPWIQTAPLFRIPSPWLCHTATVRRRGAGFLFFLEGGEGGYGAATQAMLSWGGIAWVRVVGSAGVCYRWVQQAVHYVLNDTIVNSLASCMTEVKGGVNALGAFVNMRATKKKASFFILPNMNLLRVECRFLPESEFQ